MATEFGFLEYGAAVARYLEPAAARRRHANLGVGKRGAELGRQTDGPWLVASNGTVFDLDFHWVPILDGGSEVSITAGLEEGR